MGPSLPIILQGLCLALSMLSWEQATLGLACSYSRFLSKMTFLAGAKQLGQT